MKKNTLKKNRSGFTLVEMILAVFVFSLALAGLMTISSRGLKISKESQNQVIADYLALEGVEVVRNLRDSALLRFSNQNNWQTVFNQDGCLSASELGAACSFSFTTGDTPIRIHPCVDDCKVYLNSTQGTYRQFGTPLNNPGYSDSGFTRKIFLETTDNPEEIVVISRVEWGGNSVEYTNDLFLWNNLI